ncbi:unnamed protein product [Adineta ricciae]|uniref:Uncharacterized protein n=1 Tax=Adineta ricciae TaxID=249248 RepID=A0A814E0L2_ADIRI|nr:unnamed protein product [Adineta ricciae]
MANNQTPSPKDYSALLDYNFNQLNNRPLLDAKLLLDGDQDWFLLEYLDEMELMGFNHEQTLNALLNMIGSLSNNSYSRNLLNGSPVWLNIFSHVLGATGSNKSYLANEIIHSLKILDKMYPGVYSNRQALHDVDGDEEPPRKKPKTDPWSFVASSVTEAALSKTTNYTDLMVINPDGDNALKLLSYYDQNTIGGAQGVSCFCNAYDGIEPGSNRVTGVELSSNERDRPSKMSMYVVSTGKKLSIPLIKLTEEGANDGIYGRVWYTHSNTVRQLPNILIQKQISLPNFTHVALGCHSFFQDRIIEFRYGLYRSDFDSRPRGHISAQMQDARRRQNVNLPEFHGIAMDEQDIVQQQPRGTGNSSDDSMEQASAFELVTTYVNQVWSESFTLEKHVGEMWRKVPYHLPKAITTIKVLRILFRIMGDNLLFYLNSQEGSRSYQTKLVSNMFINTLNEVLNDFFVRSTRAIQVNKQRISVLLLTPDDVEVGYSWCRWKLETTAMLFSTNNIEQIINERAKKTISNSVSKKSTDQQRIGNAMTKVLLTPTIFFTNSYLFSSCVRGGSGLFMQKKSTDLKYDIVVEHLLADGLIMKCDVIQGARTPTNAKVSPSYYKQPPSYFEQSDSRMQKLQNLGIGFNEYEKMYLNSSLPANMCFNSNGIELIKGDEWVQFYHTCLSDATAALMIETRTKMNEIIHVNGRFHLTNVNIGPTGTGFETITNDSSQEQVETIPRRLNSNNDNNLEQGNSFLTSPDSFTLQCLTTNQVGQSIQKIESVNERKQALDMFNQDNNFHPRSHSTPVINDDHERSPSTHSPLDPVSASSNQHNPGVAMLLPTKNDSDCPSSSTDANISAHTMSTVLSFSLQNESNDSLNTVIETLNSSSIQLGPVVPKIIGENRITQQEQSKIITDVLQDLVDVASIQRDSLVNSQLPISTSNKKRGRQSTCKSSTSSVNESDILNVVEDNRHPIWRKLILNKHVLASMSDLSRTVVGSNEINASRTRCIEKLLNIGLFLNGDAFLNGKEKSVLKNSPEDPRLISILDTYGIDMDEYKASFNSNSSFVYNDDVPIPAVPNHRTNKNKFTQAFVNKIQSDAFYSTHLQIDPAHVLQSSVLKRKTTSNYSEDRFVPTTKATEKY